MNQRMKKCFTTFILTPRQRQMDSKFYRHKKLFEIQQTTIKRNKKNVDFEGRELAVGLYIEMIKINPR